MRSSINYSASYNTTDVIVAVVVVVVLELTLAVVMGVLMVILVTMFIEVVEVVKVKSSIGSVEGVRVRAVVAICGFESEVIEGLVEVAAEITIMAEPLVCVVYCCEHTRRGTAVVIALQVEIQQM